MLAVGLGLQLIRDHHHMWAIRASDDVQIWLCFVESKDAVWRETCELLQDPDFDPESMPYMCADHDDHIVLYHPATGKREKIDKTELRRRRDEM